MNTQQSTDLPEAIAPNREDWRSVTQIEVILKTASRCNIACPGCYFFEGADQSWRQHDKVISRQTVRDVANFFAQGIEDLPNLKRIVFDFHGGEPTLQRPADFDWMCTLLTDSLSARVELEFHVQTNGVLLNEQWLTLFEKHKVGCGVSLDGPADVNDIARPDHRGRGTYDRAVRGLRLLQAAHAQGRLEREPGVLCTINPNASGRRIHRHFVDDLNVSRYELIIPDNSHDAPPAAPPAALARFLVEAFEEWCADDDPTMQVRIHQSVMVRMLGTTTHLFPDYSTQAQFVAFTITSSGHVEPPDELRNCYQWESTEQPHVNRVRLSDFFQSSLMRSIAHQVRHVPRGCHDCQWRKICNGGPPQTRYSRQSGFDNPSVWCEALRTYYETIFDYMLSSGVPAEKLIESVVP